MYSNNEIVHKDGFTFRVNFVDDDNNDAPWENDCGTGIVSEWTSRDKRAGERVLYADRNHHRYYDHAASMAKAKRDGWGLSADDQATLLKRLCQPRVIRRVASSEYHVDSRGIRCDIVHMETVTLPGRDPSKPLTPGEIAAEAVQRDFDHLRGWCNGDWNYCGVVITLIEDDDENAPIEYSHALWGIESNASGYLSEVADELMDEYAHELSRERNEVQHWAARGTVTA